MLGPDRGGEGLATGSRCAVLRAVGGTCPSEEVLPQGKDGSLRSIVRMREGGDRLREPNAARRLECPARCGSATQCALDLADLSQIHLKPSVRTSANGHGRPQAGRGPHSRSELPTPHLAHLAQAHSCQQLLKKNKKFPEFRQISVAELSWRAPGRVRGGDGRGARGRGADCAVGSG